MRRLWHSPWMREYGMLLVLLAIAAVFSLATINEQHPTGEDAGRQVADFILQKHGRQAKVLIVTRDAPADDLAFARGAAERLEAGGATILANVNGSPADARKTIDRLMSQGQHIDAIAANEVTAGWSIYNLYHSVGSSRCVVPHPYTWPDFLKVSNLLGIANQSAVYAIIAIGMTMVIVTGGIDLSVGSLVALASVACAMLLRNLGGGADAGLGMVVAASLGGIVLCALAGTFNGLMITRFKIPPFIVTLAMMQIARGLAYRLSALQSISVPTPAFYWLGRGQTLGVPNPVLLMVALYMIAHVVMSRMVFGRYVYAIGGNAEAARLSGVPVERMLLAVYTICGALAGLSGIVMTSQFTAGDPKFGPNYELEVITAVAVGGASLQGGRGKIFGTLIGAFIIAVTKNGMNLTGMESSSSQMIVLGAVLLAAVLLDTLKRRSAAV